jgi:hypothetical protein
MQGDWPLWKACATGSIEIAEFLLDITAIIISQDKAHKATRKPKATKSKIVAKGRGGIRGKP